LHLQDGEPYKKPKSPKKLAEAPSRGDLEKWDKFIDNSPYEDAELFSSLSNVLRIGGSCFTEENMVRYIYLTATAEGARGDVIKPNRAEKEALLGSDPEQIAKMVKDIQGRGKADNERRRIIYNYIDLLEASVLGGDRFDFNERLSADIALDHFNDRVRKEFEPKTILIPAGEFLMGSVKPPEQDRTQQKGQQVQQMSISPELVEGQGVPDKDAQDDELPQHSITLPYYYIGRYPITNLEYQHFVRETKHQSPKHWKKDTPPPDLIYHPVVNVTWYDAIEYCQWLSKETEKEYRLPTEAEWEKAVRGDKDGRIYSWGNQWDKDSVFANTAQGGKERTSKIGSYPAGASPYGAIDMIGNVREWTSSVYDEWDRNTKKFVKEYGYPYDDNIDEREDLSLGDNFRRVVRGGSFLDASTYARCAARDKLFPHNKNEFYGFRVVLQIEK
jgi:formylglycine-generating enzyme required for sulfatase activity